MKNKQNGFSMIEVMVASTLMVIVVMMLGMIFNQTSQVWRVGKQRTDIFKDARTLFGAFQRDASAAVDQATIPLSVRTLFGGMQQNFSKGSVSFFTLTGTGNLNDDLTNFNSIPRRSLSFVTYNGGNRTEQWMGGEISDTRLTGVSCRFDAFDVNISGGGATVQQVGGVNFPSYVTATMDLMMPSAVTYDVGAASSGPDREFGTTPGDPKGRDDIRTWVIR